DIEKLGVAVRVIVPLFGLPIPLETVVQLAEQLSHLLMTDRMVLRPEVRGQRPRTLAGPAEWRFGIAPRQWLDQCFEATRQVGIARDQCRPPAPGTPHP